MLLVTWLVWITGAVHSPYAALYIVIISVASLFVGPRGAMITSIGSAAAFNACALVLLNGVVPRGGPVTEESLHTIQSMVWRTSRFWWSDCWRPNLRIAS